VAEKTTKKPAATRKADATEKKAADDKKAVAKKTATTARKTAARATSRGGEGSAAAKPAAAREAIAPRTPAVGESVAAKAISVRKRTAATVAHVAQPAGEQATGWRRFRRKTKVGVVTSAKMAKTVIVTVGRQRMHPLYKKVIRLRKGFAAHDEAGDVREGDLVRIQESRPYSATKRWKVVEVLSRSGEAGAAAPRVEDIEKQLEQAEGVDQILNKPETEKEEAEAK
jgi:small subunit ribosomal protein S17